MEHLVERAYQRMVAERRDSIHYDDVGESCTSSKPNLAFSFIMCLLILRDPGCLQLLQSPSGLQPTS